MDTSGTVGAVIAWNASGSFTYDPSGQFEYLPAGSSTTDSFTYTVSDGNGGTGIATVTIAINGVNDAPTDIDLDNGSIAENQPASTVVGKLNTTDPDTGSNFTYALVPGAGDTNNGCFGILGSNLRTSVSFDYETKKLFSIRVRSTDQGGFWVERQFTITVTNVPEEHAVTAWSNSPVCEGTTIQFYGSPDGMTTYSWTGPGGWTSSLQNPTRPNATSAMSYNYSLTVTDGGWVSDPAWVPVQVNAKPMATAYSSSPVSQNDTIILWATPFGMTYGWTGPGGWTGSGNNATRPNATPAMAGTYTVTVTDSNGCTDVATTDVVVN
jgi:VCBS repeat-containing protein